MIMDVSHFSFERLTNHDIAVEHITLASLKAVYSKLRLSSGEFSPQISIESTWMLDPNVRIAHLGQVCSQIGWCPSVR